MDQHAAGGRALKHGKTMGKLLYLNYCVFVASLILFPSWEADVPTKKVTNLPSALENTHHDLIVPLRGWVHINQPTNGPRPWTQSITESKESATSSQQDTSHPVARSYGYLCGIFQDPGRVIFLIPTVWEVNIENDEGRLSTQLLRDSMHQSKSKKSCCIIRNRLISYL